MANLLSQTSFYGWEGSVIDNRMGKKTQANTRPASPYIPDVGVIALVPDKWEAPWQSRHQVLTRLARYFSVVWSTPASNWRAWRDNISLRTDDVDYGRPLAPGLTFYRPEVYLPEISRPAFLARWTRQQRLNQTQRILRSGGCRRTILYLWRPCFEPALDLIDHDLSCYHIDDEYTFSEVEQPIGEQEARVTSRVDQVFIHSPALLEKKGKLNACTAFVPNGVDYNAYATPHAEPRDLMPVPHPRIGYVGRIKRQLDLNLLLHLAQRHTDWSLVFVGPCEDRNLDGKAALIQTLLRLPNVYALGAKPVSDLPAYTQHLDVCMLCYELNDYTKFIYPLKLHEYLASGRPVVGSPIRSLEEFAHVIKLARTFDEWSEAVHHSLAQSNSYSRRIKERQYIAQQHDWEKIAGLIAYTLCERLGSDYLKRFLKVAAHQQVIKK